MNRHILYFFAVVLMFQPLSSRGQQSSLEPTVAPRAPFVCKPPAGSRWSVEISSIPEISADANSRPRPVPIRMETKIGTNNVRHSVVELSDGSSQEFYVVGGYILQKYDNADGVAVFMCDTGKSGEVDSLRQASFPCTSWLTLKTFVDVKTISSTPCYHYSADNSVKSLLPEGTEVETWIRVSDGYPQLALVGNKKYNFSKVETFLQEVTMPAPFAEALAKMRVEFGLKQ